MGIRLLARNKGKKRVLFYRMDDAHDVSEKFLSKNLVMYRLFQLDLTLKIQLSYTVKQKDDRLLNSLSNAVISNVRSPLNVKGRKTHG